MMDTGKRHHLNMIKIVFPDPQPIPVKEQTLVQFCSFLLHLYKENRPWVKPHIRHTELQRTDNKCASIEAFLQEQKKTPKQPIITTRKKQFKEEQDFVKLDESKPKSQATDPLSRLLMVELALVSKWKGIINHVIKPLQSSKIPLALPVTVMFQCLERLIPVHEEMVEKLKAVRVQGIHPGCDMGTVFQLMYPHLKLHLHYCEGLASIQKQLEEDLQSAPVSQIVVKIMKNVSTYDWPEIPVRTYQHILENLLHVKSPEHIDYFELLHAFHKFHELEQQILLAREGVASHPHTHNAQCDCIKEKNMDALSVWNDLVWPSPEMRDSMWKDGRVLKRQGTVHECLTALKSSIRMLILFNDLVVITTRSMEVLHTIPIDQFTVSDSKPDSGFFEVRKEESHEEPIILYTTREDKAKWLHIFTKATESIQ